jgi:hypothetical protein
MENGIRICRVCHLGSDITKFIIKNNKIYGKRCCKCNSKANIERLKNKHNLNKKNLDSFNNNIVVFTFENKE